MVELKPFLCDKCESLRGSKPTILVYCDDDAPCNELPMIGGVSDGKSVVTVTYLCDGHCYEQFGLCRDCFHFIQDPSNDEKLKEWEKQNERT